MRYSVTGRYLGVSTTTGADHAVLTVSNAGAMIQADDIDRMLRPFERLTGERTSHPDGHGLGLSIVAAIATAHGADLSVKPRPAGGLEVAVALPRLRAPLGSPARLAQDRALSPAGTAGDALPRAHSAE